MKHRNTTTSVTKRPELVNEQKQNKQTVKHENNQKQRQKIKEREGKSSGMWRWAESANKT